MPGTYQLFRQTQRLDPNSIIKTQRNEGVKSNNTLIDTINMMKNESMDFTLRSNDITPVHQAVIDPKSFLQWMTVFSVLTNVTLIAKPSSMATRDVVPVKSSLTSQGSNSMISGATGYLAQGKNHHDIKAKVRAVRDVVEERDALITTIAQMEKCHKIMNGIINDAEAFLLTPSYISVRCENILNNNRIVSDKFGVTLLGYGDETCLLDCDATMLRIESNIVSLNNKISEMEKMQTELNEAPITPDDKEIRVGIRNDLELLRTCIAENFGLHGECQNMKKQAEKISDNARFMRNKFNFSCDGIFNMAKPMPDFNNTPSDSASYGMRAYVADLKAFRGEIETQIVQAYNQLHVLPRIG